MQHGNLVCTGPGFNLRGVVEILTAKLKGKAIKNAGGLQFPGE